MKGNRFMDYIEGGNGRDGGYGDKGRSKGYKYYEVGRNWEGVDNYLGKLVGDNLEDGDIVKRLKDNCRYRFGRVLEGMRNWIDEENVNKDNIGGIFRRYGLLGCEEERGLGVRLD